MVSTPERPTPPVTPVTPPRAVRARILGWRNPWTMLLGALAAFQAGVIVTLLWTSGREGPPRVADLPAPVTLPAGQLSLPPAGGPDDPSTAPGAPPTSSDPSSATTGPSTPSTTGPSTPSTPSTTGPANPSTPSIPSTTGPSTPSTTGPSTPSTTGPRPGRKPHTGEPPRPPGDATPATPTPDAAVDETAMIEVEVLSEPEGATVRIGGAVWGVTPLTALLPASGKVVVNLELAGHESARVPWSASSGRRTVRATLVPLESP